MHPDFRDVKSSNVLLTKEGVAKVSDVGHSIVVDYYSSHTQAAGTFAYAAPELLMGCKCTPKVRIGIHHQSPADTSGADEPVCTHWMLDF